MEQIPCYFVRLLLSNCFWFKLRHRFDRTGLTVGARGLPLTTAELNLDRAAGNKQSSGEFECCMNG